KAQAAVGGALAFEIGNHDSSAVEGQVEVDLILVRGVQDDGAFEQGGVAHKLRDRAHQLHVNAAVKVHLTRKSRRTDEQVGRGYRAVGAKSLPLIFIVRSLKKDARHSAGAGIVGAYRPDQ